MQKYIILNISLIAAFVLLCFFGDPNIMCDQKSIKEKAKKSLDPYAYDSAMLTRIQYKKKEAIKETEVDLFIGEKYRLVFNTEALPKPVKIEIYDKDLEARKRTLLWSNKDVPFETKQFTFEIERARRVFVDYTVPLADSSAASGCVCCMVGFQIKGK
jgi:hypothetical protein